MDKAELWNEVKDDDITLMQLSTEPQLHAEPCVSEAASSCTAKWKFAEMIASENVIAHLQAYVVQYS